MKKPFTRLLRLISLSILSFICFLGAHASKEPSNDASLKRALQSNPNSSAPWLRSYQPEAEIIPMRNRNMKHFRNASGNFSAFIANGSIHYKQGNQWFDIDNNIVENSYGLFPSKPFANVTNNFQTFYPANPFKQSLAVVYNGETYEERLIAISFLDANDNKISSLPISATIKPMLLGNQLVYRGVFEGVDLMYTQTNDGKKLDLIVHSASFLQFIPTQAVSIVIEEELTLPGGLTISTENGITLSRNGNVEVNYPLPTAIETFNPSKPYGNDNDLNTSGSLKIVNQSGNRIVVQSAFNVNWLREPSRSFPVKLDPSANYGPFAVSMATGYMTSATGTKTNGFLRLASTNTFAWAKFDISGLGSTGITSVDSARYWGYHYTTTGADKLAKVSGMANVDPVSALNTAIVSQINTGPLYRNNYTFGGSAFQWRTALLDTSLADTAIVSSVARGWFAIGMVYLSGNTTFMYQYGWNGVSGSVCYLEVNYQTAPCTNPVAAGSVIGNSLVCGGSSTSLSLVGASVGTGVTYQWQSSPDSLTWTNITGALSPSYAPVINSDSTYFRCQVICSGGTPAYTPARVVYGDIFKVTSANPYNEGFESITAANQLPNCMASTNLGSLTLTYITPTGSYNQAARTGNKYGSFRYGCNDFFFTKGLRLVQGVTYSFSTWFVTDGFTGSWDSVALYVATGTTSSTATLLPGTTLIQPSNTTYQQLVGSFTPSVTGVYRFAFKVKDAGIPWYLSIDDIKVEEALPPTLTTGTKSNITTSGATLSGTIIANGGAAVTTSGVVVSTSVNPVRGGFGVIDSSTNPLVSMGAFSVNIGGLSNSTTYHYRAYAVNPLGTSYGADSVFTTNSSAVVPSVVRVAASNIQAYSATFGGNITSDGGSPVFTSGVVFSTSPNPVIGGFGVVDSSTNPVVATGIFNFTTAGLSPGTKYYFRAYAMNSIGTTYSVQDSFNTAPVVATFPYVQNFDTVAVNTGWTSAPVTGTLNDWALGVPAKTTLSAAFSAPRAWITKLTGNYSTSHDAAIVSPQFNFSGLLANPILRFKHKFYTESCCDGGILEISVNGGLTWTKVENVVGTGTNFNTTNATGWYNSTTQGNSWCNLSSAYATASNGWITSMIALPGAAGQSNVKIRFRFITDTSVEYDGWEIDDIEVFVPTPPTVSTGTKTNVTTNNATLSGTIINNGGNAITASGIVFSTSTAPTRGSFGVVDSATNPLVTSGAFSLNVSGLFPSTTYYYRTYAVNALGTSYGPDSSFITPSSAVLPTVLRTGAVNVTTTTAVLGANITSDGGSAVYASGIIYGTTPGLVIGGFGVVDSTKTPAVTGGAYTISPSGLTHSTKYYYRAYAMNSVGTAYSVEDSFTTAPIISVYPYTQNFDAFGTTGWTSTAVTGTLNDWAVGSPTKTTLSAAFSLPNAWVTKLSGNYSTSHDAALVSPQFDFSSITTDPVLRFMHKFYTESCCDGGILEVSINGGTWTKVLSSLGTGTNFNLVNAYSWYNGTTQGNSWANLSSAFASQTNGWIQTAVRIPGAAGQSNVRFRFRFITDTSVEYDGWAIDNIEVVDVVTPTIAASNVTSTPSATSANVSFTSGNGQGRLVVARLTSTTAVAPFDTVLYTASTVFGSGSTTGTGNFVVYIGSGNSVNVTGLTALTGYSFDVYEFNGKYMHNKFTIAANGFTTTTPVKLLNFVAVKKSDDGVLSWVTASEVNNRGFEIERSVDGKNFEQISFVKGKGNSNVKVSYAYTDAEVFAKGISKVYYRLKQVDNDGKFNYSGIVMLANDVKATTVISAYPNPFTNQVTVNINASRQGKASIEVYDISGRKVSTHGFDVEEGSNAFSITQVSELRAGIYFVKVLVDGEEKVIKMVKN